ncbi:DUF3047 domain-containing protein [Neptunomonas phycophila]|uniref:DUF3047 domain-containing protein n=1 Tax=Neptunomonas phycophila TaxID=1572645 RepID=A0ABT9EPU7_9GAMM|nr:DUF3047 domain-containing protein [Neptunomonas phycophila]MDP2521093.1 DUF3047 domain-containing protein [Neptunomonas phycophila]
MSETHRCNHSRRNAIKTLAAAPLLAPCASAFANAPEPPPSPVSGQSLQESVTQLQTLSNAPIKRIERFQLAPTDLPWQKSLGKLEQGQAVTFLLTGHWWFFKEQSRWLEPGFVFFARTTNKTGSSVIYNAMQNTGTFYADRNGSLEIARSVGEFASPQGDLWVPIEQYQASEGHVEGIAIIWEGDPKKGLTQLSSAGDVQGMLKAELQRQRLLSLMPEGWSNIFMFGDGSIYTENAKGHIDCETHKNVGILQYPLADQPLVSNLQLDWDWIVHQLPSTQPEDTLLAHDYLSMAVEFDDGQDITYMWSSSLPVGKVFRCPIPGWDQVETHVVQRSGTTQLGQWVSEQRNLYDDYKTIINGPATRVVRVWLIANSLFMRQYGECAYQAIRIGPTGQQQTIL